MQSCWPRLHGKSMFSLCVILSLHITVYPPGCPEGWDDGCFHLLAKERPGKGNQHGFVMEIYALSCSVIHVQNHKMKRILFCFLHWRGVNFRERWQQKWLGLSHGSSYSRRDNTHNTLFQISNTNVGLLQWAPDSQPQGHFRGIREFSPFFSHHSLIYFCQIPLSSPLLLYVPIILLNAEKLPLGCMRSDPFSSEGNQDRLMMQDKRAVLVTIKTLGFLTLLLQEAAP